MNKEQLDKISKTVDRLSLEILLPLRTSKTLNETAIRELELALDNLEVELKGEVVVPKQLVGDLLFIFASILTEARYAKNSQQMIEETAWRIEDKMERIFRQTNQ